MKLYSFFRSGTSHRLRIALNLKGLTPDYSPVDLRVDAQLEESYKAVNPQGLVPALTLDNDTTLLQSTAIIEWLDECYPEPAFLPKDPEARAYVRALASIIGCDVHPINNRRVLQYLRKNFSNNDAAINSWCAHWITAGFDTIETLLAKDRKRHDFCFGDTPSLADIYLIPQIESASRFNVDMTKWPLIRAVDKCCSSLPSFAKAAPMVQPDA